MNKKTAFFICISLIAFMAFSCHSKSSKTKGHDKKDQTQSFLTGYIVKPIQLDKAITVSGTLKPFEETVLMPEISGRVVKINLPEGKFVKTGTLLVKLFDGDLQANLKKLDAQLAILEQTNKRQSELMKVSGLSQQDYDQTVLQIHSMKADIDVLQTQINKTEVRAPFDGVIGLRNVSVGAIVSPATSLTTIRTVNKLKLDFSVPEQYSSELKPGMKIQFTVHGADEHYDATVMATEREIEQDTRNLKIRALVNSKSEQLTPGAFATVELIMGKNSQALMIPTQAIIPSERDKSVIVSKNGKATFVKVKTGIRKESSIEITDGIHVGDTVVTTGILFIKDGMKLKFSNVKSDSL